MAFYSVALDLIAHKLPAKPSNKIFNWPMQTEIKQKKIVQKLLKNNPQIKEATN